MYEVLYYQCLCFWLHFMLEDLRALGTFAKVLLTTNVTIHIRAKRNQRNCRSQEDCASANQTFQWTRMANTWTPKEAIATCLRPASIRRVPPSATRKRHVNNVSPRCAGNNRGLESRLPLNFDSATQKHKLQHGKR